MNHADELMLKAGTVVNWEGRALGTELGAVLGPGEKTGDSSKPPWAGASDVAVDESKSRS
jgi:hypothetical protein